MEHRPSIGNVLPAASNPEYDTGLPRSASPPGSAAAGFQHPLHPKPGSSAGDPQLRLPGPKPG